MLSILGRRPNGFLGLSLNDGTILFRVILLDKTVSVGIRQSLHYDARLLRTLQPGACGQRSSRGRVVDTLCVTDARVFSFSHLYLGASTYDISTRGGTGVPKKQMEVTKSADLCT